MSTELNTILCPKCGEQIPISEALTHRIEEKYKKELEQLKSESASTEKRLEEKFQKQYAQREEELKKVSRDFIQKEKEKLKQELEEQAKQKISLEMSDLRKQNEEQNKKLEEMQKNELELRAQRRDLESKQKTMELEMQRKLDEEKQIMSLQIQKNYDLKLDLQQKEYEKKLEDTQKALEDAQRRASASSERFRGEVQELNVEDLLRTTYIYDEIKEVPKGFNGADILHEVRDEFGKNCGLLVWEIKRTKSFNDDWAVKLKDDVIRAKGKVGIIVTQVLPYGIDSFGVYSGVWVTNFSSFIQLAAVLRLGLIDLKRMEKLNEGKDFKMSQVYNYLTSDEFKHKMVSIVENFKAMQEQLEVEKRAIQKQWAMRDMQIRRMIEGTVSMIGDLQGIMGGALPKIEGMELPGLGFE